MQRFELIKKVRFIRKTGVNHALHNAEADMDHEDVAAAFAGGRGRTHQNAQATVVERRIFLGA